MIVVRCTKRLAFAPSTPNNRRPHSYSCAEGPRRERPNGISGGFMRAERRWFVPALLCVLGLSVHAVPASAGAITIDTKFQGVTVGYAVNDPTHPLDSGFFPGVIGSAQMSHAQGVGIDPALTFDAYCVDLFTDIFESGTSTQTVPVMVTATAEPISGWFDQKGHTLNGPAAGSRVAWLYEHFAAAATGHNDL